MNEKQGFSLQTVLLVSALVGAAAFAVGRSFHGSSIASEPATTIVNAAPATAPMPEGTDLPLGHPAIDPQMPMGAAGNADLQAPEESNLVWKAPARWQAVPSTSTMRLATYRIPKAPGDDEDPELYVMQAGGSIDDNIDRWIGQFGDEGRRTVKRSKAKVNGFDVTRVELEGTFDGGMSKPPRRETGWSLYGVIVETPGMPHFFKMTGPTKSVKAARAEAEQMVATLTLR